MPWQEWGFIHGLELNPDGTYRFRTVLVLASRQNGKTTLLKILALWRMTEDDGRMVLGTSTNMEYAREAWNSTVDLASEKLPNLVAKVKYGALDTSLTMVGGARYKVATASRTGGRSLAVDLGIADELREHRPKGEDTGWEAWAALDGTTTARPRPQVWALSNMGDHRSVVLNHFREVALAEAEAGEGDGSLCLMEWSAPEGCDPDDREAWRLANPALGHTITEATLISKRRLPLTVFRTEHLCQNVDALDGPVDSEAWKACADPTLDSSRSDWVACVDVAPDSAHVTLVLAAALDDGRVRLMVAGAWETTREATATDRARRELPGLLDEIKPRRVAWFPSGPAKPLAPMLRPPKDTPEETARRYVELTGGQVSEACMGLADLVGARAVVHPDDELLTAHVTGTQKLAEGDAWRFVRRGVGHVDAAYAAGGAALVALTHPPDPPRERPRVLSPTPA